MEWAVTKSGCNLLRQIFFLTSLTNLEDCLIAYRAQKKTEKGYEKKNPDPMPFLSIPFTCKQRHLSTVPRITSTTKQMKGG